MTGPATAVGSPAAPISRSQQADASGMVRVRLDNHPLTASAALVWNGDLPRPLQQVLFETADSLQDQRGDWCVAGRQIAVPAIEG